MRLAFSRWAVSVLGLLVAACGGSSQHRATADSRYPTTIDLSVRISPEKPPSPRSWPRYPHFPEPACWAAPFQRGALPIVLQVAPSYVPRPARRPVKPRTVARRLLVRFGDLRFVRSIRFTPAPPAVGKRLKTLYAGGHPPPDGLEAAIITARGEPTNVAQPGPRQSITDAIVNWETNLIGGALRDDLCAAGGAPLVSWRAPRGSGVSQRTFALEQRFPNPSAAAFRRRVARVGRRYGFRVISLRLLRPRQIAPLLIVGTSRSRRTFAHEIPRIIDLLNPYSRSRHRFAQTFEGFLFAAEDARGPFAEVQMANRGLSESGEWAASRCDYPYPTLAPNSCPGTR